MGLWECKCLFYQPFARVAELVDAPDSESGVRKDVLVRLQSRAPLIAIISGSWPNEKLRPTNHRDILVS